MWEGGLVSLSHLCLSATVGSAARLCLCVSLLHGTQFSVVEASKNAGQQKIHTQNNNNNTHTSLWSGPHFSAAGPVGWIHPRIKVPFCGSWGFCVFASFHLQFAAPSSLCGVVKLYPCYVRLGCIHATPQPTAFEEQDLGPCKQRREGRSGGDSLKPRVEFVWEDVLSSSNMPRKKPFSNKQKKKQLQVKRERKRGEWRHTLRRASLSR